MQSAAISDFYRIGATLYQNLSLRKDGCADFHSVISATPDFVVGGKPVPDGQEGRVEENFADVIFHVLRMLQYKLDFKSWPTTRLLARQIMRLDNREKAFYIVTVLICHD